MNIKKYWIFFSTLLQQQAASLARKMAGKKGQATQLQVEVNNEEDWEKLLTREGLIGKVLNILIGIGNLFQNIHIQ